MELGRFSGAGGEFAEAQNERTEELVRKLGQKISPEMLEGAAPAEGLTEGSEGSSAEELVESPAEDAKQGYDVAQREIGQLLDGKTREEFLAEQQEKLEQLKADWAMEKASIIVKLNNLWGQERKEEEERLKAGRLAEIEAQLAEEERKYDLINHLPLDEAGEPILPEEVMVDAPVAEAVLPNVEEVADMPEPVLPKAEEVADKSEVGEKQPVNFEIEELDPNSDAYDTEAKVRRSTIERAVLYFAAESREVILQQLAKTEEREQAQRQVAPADFETSAAGDGSDEEVEAAAAAAGESILRPSRTEEQANRDYRAGMMEMAREAVPGRFDRYDPELAEARLAERLKQAEAQAKAEEARAKAAEAQAEKEYFDKLHAMAVEAANSPIKNRFGDPEIVENVREKRIGRLFKKLAGRILRRGGGVEKERKKEKPAKKGLVDYSNLSDLLMEMLSGDSLT